MRKISVGLIVVMLLTSIMSVQTVSASDTSFNYADAFAKSIIFYEENWCGPDAGNNRVKWRGPCHVDDGKDVKLDLSGGFHDCGDHVKFGLPQCCTGAVLGWGYYEFKDTFVEKGQDKYMLNILKHFTDYFLKCFKDDNTFYYQCGDGDTDHAYWGPPELQKTSRPTYYVANPSNPGSDVAGDASAALALMYLNYSSVDKDYANECLTAAKKLYAFGQKYRGNSKGQSYYGPKDYHDELMWGATWLYIATNDKSYLTDIDNLMTERGLGGYNTYENHWGLCWEDVNAAAFLKLAQVTDNPKYKKIAEYNLNYWINDLKASPGGMKTVDAWGALKYPAAESLLALVYYKTSGKEEYLNFAKGQIDYILGKNPHNYSYMVGFGDKYPLFPHHRAASGRLEGLPADEKKGMPQRHILYGALVGGPGMDDNYPDDIELYQHSEVGLDYNSGLVGALAGISKYFGKGQQPGPMPGIEAQSPEYYVEAQEKKDNNQVIVVNMYIHNTTFSPPQYEKDLTIRYFVDLSEYYEKGLDASVVSVSKNYAPLAVNISPLKPWDEAKHIYYTEISWPDLELYGKTSVEIAISAYSATCGDSSNDFSRKGLTEELTRTENIPIYKGGKKVYGKDPSGGQTDDLLGDVNGDKVVNVVDATMIKSVVTKKKDQTIFKKPENADMNKDGSVNSLDYLLVKKVIQSQIN